MLTRHGRVGMVALLPWAQPEQRIQPVWPTAQHGLVRRPSTRAGRSTGGWPSGPGNDGAWPRAAKPREAIGTRPRSERRWSIPMGICGGSSATRGCGIEA